MTERRVRVVTWNIHMGVGRDGRRDLERIAREIQRFDADILALQEVENLRPAGVERDELADLAAKTGLEAVAGPTMLRSAGDYGNAVLTRRPVRKTSHHDISIAGREPRGILEIEFDIDGQGLRLLTTHFGLRRRERQRQLKGLCRLLEPDDSSPQVLLGDFNVWNRRSLMLRPLRRFFPRPPLPATFPARFPLFPLDRIYLRGVEAPRLWTFDDQTIRIASDHLPLAAEFRLPA